MNFNVGIKSISISKEAKKVFEELDDIRPKHISFSLMLAIAADEYTKQHKKGLVKLDDFVVEGDDIKLPKLLADIEDWVAYISNANTDSVKDIQQRLLQIQNIMDGRDEHSLY